MSVRDREREDIRTEPAPEPEQTARAPAGPLSSQSVLALQRTAGNQAVERLIGSTAGAEGLEHVMVDSIAPQELPPGAAELRSREESPATAEVGRRLARSARARLQRKEADTLDLCPRYWRYETPHDVAGYNCAGLAWRSYDYRGNLAAERSAASAGTASRAPGAVKHWFWEYDLHLETDDGRRTATSHDFHTVAGVVDKSSSDPDDVYSKNGGRPVYGPRTGPAWRPPARDRATSNDPSETPATTADGAPLYKVRSNFREIVALHSCPGP